MEKPIPARQTALKRYDIHKWASEFMKALHKTIEKKAEHHARKITARIKNKIFSEYNDKKSKVLFLDYDGTLQRFFANPQAAKPDEELYELLDKLTVEKNTKMT